MSRNEYDVFSFENAMDILDVGLSIYMAGQSGKAVGDMLFGPVLGGVGGPSPGKAQSMLDDAVNISNQPMGSNPKLKNIIKNLYKGQNKTNKVGNGTTMDAIRNEISTGKATMGKWHTIKGQESLSGLKNLLDKGGLSSSDAIITKALIADLTNALAGK